MKAPKTPSPKRERKAEQKGASNKRDADRQASSRHDPAVKELPKLENESVSQRSRLTTPLLCVFCVGLFFFAAESVRYAIRVGGYGELSLNPIQQKATTDHDNATPEEDTNLNKGEAEQKTVAESSQKDEIQPSGRPRTIKRTHISRGIGKNRFTASHRALKMGRGKRRGGRRPRGRNSDLLFLNGGIAPGLASNIQTEPAVTRVMTNIEIFQQGLGFLPPGTNFILAPAPRRGRGRRSKRRGRGRRSKGRSRSGFRSGFRTRFPTIQPSHQPSSAPTAAPSAVPSTLPSSVPSSIPSFMPSSSDVPSSSPSGGGPTLAPTTATPSVGTPGTPAPIITALTMAPTDPQ